MLSYLKKHQNSQMLFDPTEPDVDMDEFHREDWGLIIYGDVKEDMLPIVSFDESGTDDMTDTRGQGFTMTVYSDCDLGSGCVTCRSRAGFDIFLNAAPIYCRSEKQQSCEVSTFGSEFTAMKQAIKYVRGLRCKLQMMGIPCDDPAFVYGENKPVLANTTVNTSTFKKDMNILSYHFVSVGCSQDEFRTAYVNMNLNLADLPTKPLPSGEKLWVFVRRFLYWI